jgi:hypothetical protein
MDIRSPLTIFATPIGSVRRGRPSVAAALLLFLIAPVEVIYAQGVGGGRFVSAGQMTRARRGHTATLLRDGRVLIVGGFGVPPDGEIRDAEVYVPASGTFVRLPAELEDRGGHTATLLADGRVLIAGGCCPADLQSALIFDPETGGFSPTGRMVNPRWLHNATLLRDGRVLLLGGYSDPFEPEWSVMPEIYDPTSGTFSSAVGVPPGEQKFPDQAAAASLLQDGRVLIAGPNPPEVFDPASSSYGFAAKMLSESYRHGSEGLTATLLRDGTVLLAGGGRGGCAGFQTAEIYDPSSDSFTITGPTSWPRRAHTATLLTDGNVLLAGGYGEHCFGVNFGELYDSSSRSFIPLGSMAQPRTQHTATLLLDGSVLIAGGYDRYGDVLAAELFVPSNSPLPSPGPGAGQCLTDEDTSCLLGRFRVEVRYRTAFSNGAVDALARAKVTGGFADANFETVFFYFNSPNNAEVMVKALDQGNRQGDTPTIAVVTGVATPLRVEVQVTDTRPGGASKTYLSEFGSQAGATDFTAFPK